MCEHPTGSARRTSAPSANCLSWPVQPETFSNNEPPFAFPCEVTIDVTPQKLLRAVSNPLRQQTSAPMLSTIYIASLKLVKLKSRTFNGGTMIGVPGPSDSLAFTRSGRPSPSTLFSMKMGDSLNRRFFTARVTFPCSIRNVPSRVSPVCRIVRGSTLRMYQKLWHRVYRSQMMAYQRHLRLNHHSYLWRFHP